MTALHTMAELRQLLAYDPATGTFMWLVRPSAKVAPGSVAGKVRPRDGYRLICVRGKHYYAHRLAFYFINGRWPEGQIDHINGNRDDNRQHNLREASPSQNAGNSGLRSNNNSGFKGVHFAKTHNLWRARIKWGDRYKSLGYFSTPEAAHGAYMAAAHRIFGAFARAK